MRGCKLAIAALLLLTVLAAPAQAWHLSSLPDPGEREVRDIRNRVLATKTNNLDDAPAGNLLTFTFPWDPEFTHADVGHTIRVHVSYTATFPNTNDGQWNVSVAKEATGNLDHCNVIVETVNPVGVTLDALLVYAHYEWSCLFTQSEKTHPHNHTVWVNRTAQSGSPNPMESEAISVRLETEDIIITCPTNEHSTQVSCMSFANLGFDGFLILLALAGLVYFAFRRGLDKNPVWAGALLIFSWSFISLVLEDYLPVEVQLPFPWAMLAALFWVLLIYGIAGAGFTTGEWLRRRREKEEQE